MIRTNVAIKILFCLFSFQISFNAPIAYAIRNYEGHPDLRKAMEYDSELNGYDMTKANREKAVYHYSKYLEEATDSFQQARVYCQLGAMYAVSFNHQKGEKADYDKARKYYQKVLELEPDRIGRPTIVARNMLSTLTNDGGMGRIKARMDVYKWLSEIDDEKIKNNWLPLTPASQVKDLSKVQDESDNTEAVSTVPTDRLIPSNNKLIKLKNLIVSLKEGAVYNASYDAMSIEYPDEGFMYILDALPSNAPERKIVREVMQERMDRIANMGLRYVLDSWIETEEQSTDKIADNHEEVVVKRKFIPHIDIARSEKKAFVFDLQSGKLIATPVQETVDNKVINEILSRQNKGDIAWDGSLITFRNSKAHTVAKESKRALKLTKGEYITHYNLPEKLKLPYSTLIEINEKKNFLITIYKIEDNGVWIFYKGLNPKEVEHYLVNLTIEEKKHKH